MNFNPRTREGCDRPWIRGTWGGWSDFNPRTREGCDTPFQFISIYWNKISIHAPARGATFHLRFSFLLLLYFNPRTREGCDVLILNAKHYDFIFQSTHPRGVRLVGALLASLGLYISIHAPARGATVFLSPSRAFFHTAKSFLSVLSLFCVLFCETASALFCSARPLKASVNPIPGCSSRPIPWSRPGAPNFSPDCRFVWNLSLDQLYHVIWI